MDFTEDDIAQLSMIPLMGGQMSRKDKIKEGIFIAKEEHNDMADKVMAMLYTLADKFLDGAELDEIKEAMTMTRLGQMIEKDGREKERIALNTLNKKLLSSNRIEDCIKATEDEDFDIDMDFNLIGEISVGIDVMNIIRQDYERAYVIYYIEEH